MRNTTVRAADCPGFSTLVLVPLQAFAPAVLTGVAQTLNWCGSAPRLVTLKVTVAEEAFACHGSFDRFESAHRANLFDMNAKYATVIGLPEAIDYLDELVKSD